MIAEERASRSIFFFFLPLAGLFPKRASMGIMSLRATGQIKENSTGMGKPK